MKQLLFSSLLLMLTFGSISCTAQDNKQTKSEITNNQTIEVYYFHFTRRCFTCNKVEEESKKALETLYSEEIQKGTVKFTSINLDDESSKAIAEKSKASGQGLLVIQGDTRIDLTSQGFMYATNNPEKLSQELKKAIDPLLSK